MPTLRSISIIQQAEQATARWPAAEFEPRWLHKKYSDAQGKPRGPRLVHVLVASVGVGYLQGQLQYFQNKGFEVVVLCPRRRCDEWEVERPKGVVYIEVPMERKIAPLQDLVSLWRLWRIMRALQPTVTNVGNPKAGLLGGLAAWLSRVPCRIYTLHGLRFESTTGLKRRLLIFTERLACGFAHRVLCVSRSVRETAIACALTGGERTAVLGNGSCNGMDTSRFVVTPARLALAAELRLQFGIPEQAPVVLFVGRLTCDKGIPELMKAFLRLENRFPELRLLLVGCLENEDPLPADTRIHLKAHPRVIFVGAANDTAPYYALADILVLPSHREGLPTVILEAQAAGKPVVGASATGIVDVVEDGETGLLFPIGDVAALVESLTRLLTDKALADRLGAAGQDQVKRKFRQELVWEALYREYFAILQPKGRMSLLMAGAQKSGSLVTGSDLTVGPDMSA
jgi:Glycosyltransferase